MRRLSSCRTACTEAMVSGILRHGRASDRFRAALGIQFSRQYCPCQTSISELALELCIHHFPASLSVLQYIYIGVTQTYVFRRERMILLQLQPTYFKHTLARYGGKISATFSAPEQTTLAAGSNQSDCLEPKVVSNRKTALAQY